MYPQSIQMHSQSIQPTGRRTRVHAQSTQMRPQSMPTTAQSSRAHNHSTKMHPQGMQIPAQSSRLRSPRTQLQNAFPLPHATPPQFVILRRKSFETGRLTISQKILSFGFSKLAAPSCAGQKGGPSLILAGVRFASNATPRPLPTADTSVGIAPYHGPQSAPRLSPRLDASVGIAAYR